MKLTKEQKKIMNTLTEQHVIQDMKEDYFEDEFKKDKSEAKRHFRAGYIAAVTGCIEGDDDESC